VVLNGVDVTAGDGERCHDAVHARHAAAGRAGAAADDRRLRDVRLPFASCQFSSVVFIIAAPLRCPVLACPAGEVLAYLWKDEGRAATPNRSLLPLPKINSRK